MQEINLSTPLSLITSFRFPLQSAAARKDVIIGGLLLLVPIVGWLLNMGHRIQFVHNMMHGKSAWPAWKNYGALLKHGIITCAGMAYYYLPSAVLTMVYARTELVGWAIAAAVAFLLATIAIPGYMSHYCKAFDPHEIFNPVRACSRVFDCGRSYWHAWLIALAAMLLSILGLLALGIGFLFTSVWFWQVAGFSFASAMARQHGLA